MGSGKVYGFSGYIVPGFETEGWAAVTLSPYGAPNTGRCVVQYSTDVALSAGVLLQGDRLGPERPGNRAINYGGISKDLTATGGPQVIEGAWPLTTQMPNQSTGIVDYVLLDFVGLMKVVGYVDGSKNLVCEDPYNTFQTQGSNQSIQTICSRYRAPKKVIVNPEDGTTLYILNVGCTIFNGFVQLKVNEIYEAGDGINSMVPFAVVGNGTVSVFY